MVTNRRPQDNGNDAAHPSLKADAADHGGGDAFEHQAAAEIWFARTCPRGQHQRSKSGQQRAHDIGEGEVALARQSCQMSGARVVADQIERSPEHRVIEQEIQATGDYHAPAVSGIEIPGIKFAIVEQAAEGVGNVEHRSAAGNRGGEAEADVEAAERHDERIDSRATR